MLKILLVASFLIALSGCTTGKPLTVTNTIIKYEVAPKALLKDCPTVYIPWETAGDIVNENTALRGALATCSTQIKGLQSWNNELLKKNAASVN